MTKMDWAKQYEKLKLDTTRDRRKLAQFEHGCSALEHHELWKKAKERREMLDEEEYKDWREAQEQDTARAYWRHMRSWPHGLRASEAKDLFMRRMFWNPPKDKPKAGLLQSIFQEVFGFVLGLVLLGLAGLALFGGALFVINVVGMGDDPRFAVLLAIVALTVLIRVLFKASWIAALALGMLSMVPAVFILGGLSSIVG